MTDLTSEQLVEVILRGLAEARADIAERERLLKDLELSPVTKRALAGLTAPEVTQILADLSRSRST
ncbi:MAG TPA: hypothetical protein VGH49_03855 [Xanthobacteraceae bacterium]